MDEPKTAGESPRCESCGAAASAAVAEPVTHCEWCGAEYPTPDDGPPAPTQEPPR